jgi:hypothetical protein
MERIRMCRPRFLKGLAAGRAAIDLSRCWDKDEGVKLTVGFIDTPETALRARILGHMNAWGAQANVVFTESTNEPRVRIARWDNHDSADDWGYWSVIGTDIDLIAPDRPTMNLEKFTMDIPEAEFHRVVRHEAGHTLGFVHEHQRKEIIDRLDPAKVIAEYRRTQGWSEEEVWDQVLTPRDLSSIFGTPHAEEDSIMCYHLDGSLTKDGEPIVGGVDITADDHAFAASVYPK